VETTGQEKKGKGKKRKQGGRVGLGKRKKKKNIMGEREFPK